MFFPQSKAKTCFLSLYVDRWNFFQRILSLQINLSNILVHVVFHSNPLPHSDPRLHFLSLNLTKSLITRPNDILNLLPPGEAMPWAHRISLFFNSFIYVSAICFPTRSTMHFCLCCYNLARVSEKIQHSGQPLLVDQNDLWKHKSNFISLLPKTFQRTDSSLMAN